MSELNNAQWSACPITSINDSRREADMRKCLSCYVLASVFALSACANTAANQADLSAAYNVAVAVEAAYVANPKTTPEAARQAAALLASAQAALLAWQNAPIGSTIEAATLSAAIAALVAFEAQANQSVSKPTAQLDCSLPPFCGDGVHRG